MAATSERIYGFYFLGALGAWAFLVVVRYIIARGCKCPLCHGPWLLNRKCRMNDKARKYPGLRYRTSLMLDAFFRWNFRCQYCGTPFRLKR